MLGVCISSCIQTHACILHTRLAVYVSTGTQGTGKVTFALKKIKIKKKSDNSSHISLIVTKKMRVGAVVVVGGWGREVMSG